MHGWVCFSGVYPYADRVESLDSYLEYTAYLGVAAVVWFNCSHAHTLLCFLVCIRVLHAASGLSCVAVLSMANLF